MQVGDIVHVHHSLQDVLTGILSIAECSLNQHLHFTLGPPLPSMVLPVTLWLWFLKPPML